MAQHASRLLRYLERLDTEITPENRTQLLDWMIGIADNLGVKQDTYHLTVYLLD
jgi:hypothetical protein